MLLVWYSTMEPITPYATTSYSTTSYSVRTTTSDAPQGTITDPEQVKLLQLCLNHVMGKQVVLLPLPLPLTLTPTHTPTPTPTPTHS